MSLFEPEMSKEMLRLGQDGQLKRRRAHPIVIDAVARRCHVRVMAGALAGEVGIHR